VVATPTPLLALRRSDGHRLWSTPIVPGAQQQEGTEPADGNSSVAITAGAGRLLVLAKRPLTAGYPTHAVAWEANLYAIDAADGTHLWRTSVEDDPSGTAHAPVVAGDVAYVQWGAGITAVSLAADRADQLWRFIPAPPPTSPQAAMSGAAVAGGVV